jgi:hypothetical protein
MTKVISFFNGHWGLGIWDWGLGIGDWALGIGYGKEEAVLAGGRSSLMQEF